jgi:uncharacterized metal-binding protein
MEINKLYSTSDLQTMKLADEARMPGKNRVEELRNYAKLAGHKRLGIAHCVAVQKEADLLKQTLLKDFEIFSIDCKCGKIPSGELLGNEARGISCNPAGQASYLVENGTELNIVMGLCVGHDMVFTSKSQAPSTTLIVKDREHKHNPMETFK